MAAQRDARSPRIPGATYRIQLTKDFTFRDALALVDYWSALGITDLYTAPFFKARPGSVHGYDVVDPGVINPEIGTEEDLARLHEALARHDMGLLMDIVPNHMCVATNDNAWWNDVLENGPSSPYARYFDIDWRPPKSELRDKVLLPVLGNQYGKVLEAGELQLGEENGALFVSYYERRFPIGPGTYPVVLDATLARMRAGAPGEKQAISELERLNALAWGLPLRSDLDADRVQLRQREKEALKAGLRALLNGSPAARAAFDATLRLFNGTKGQPRSFDKLEDLLSAQAYRLSFWRVAAEQINYRRFFEINDLAAIRIEDPSVMEAVHAKCFELVGRGWVTGLRVDHVDGLREPRRYLDELAARTQGLYVVVEKILAADERLPLVWATEGTTGYEFLNVLNGVYVCKPGERPLRALYDGLRTVGGSFEDVVYQSKRLILQAAMSSELSVLARRLDRLSEQHRWSRDFTAGTLQQVLAETIACFPVYRTYVAVGDVEVSPQDQGHIRTALNRARKRNPAVDASAFDFLGEVLLMRDPDGLSDAERAERRDFVLRFQQLTGPVMAKGLEDTTFYRYFPLLSLNEVGGGPDRFGLTLAEFHRLMEERSRERPGALSGTSTHDTKRGEDGRARLDVLTEIPDAWTEAVTSWRELAARLKPKVDGEAAPDPDDEYYIFQTLVAALPPGELDGEALSTFATRVQGAVEKAIREAKRNTSWVNPDSAYEEATRTFVSKLLDAGGPFLPALSAFVQRIGRPALLGSLSQLVVKATAPGVPDFFQGTELWDLSMVDPDNRRAVDFATRRRALDEVRGAEAPAQRAALLRRLWETAEDGRIKLFLTHHLLTLRRAERELLARGAYLPLAAEGGRHDHVVAFARRWQRRVIITLAGRFFAQMGDPAALPTGGWDDTVVRLPPELQVGPLQEVVSGARIEAHREGDAQLLSLSRAFAALPMAVLVGDVQGSKKAD